MENKLDQYTRIIYSDAMFEAHRRGHHMLGDLLAEYLDELDAKA